MEIIYGISAVLKAISSKLPITKIYLTRNNFDRFSNALQNIPYEITNFYQLCNLAKTRKHQGFVALWKKEVLSHDFNGIVKKLNLQKNACVVVIDHVTDAGNFGAILRTCAYFNAAAVIYSHNHQASVNCHTFKAAAGSLMMIPLVEVANITYAIEKLKKNDFWIFATHVQLNNCQNLIDFDFTSFAKLVVVIGNEATGIRQLVLKSCDYSLSIPSMLPSSTLLDSLNVNAALSIFMYEICKQKYWLRKQN